MWFWLLVWFGWVVVCWLIWYGVGLILVSFCVFVCWLIRLLLRFGLKINLVVMLMSVLFCMFVWFRFMFGLVRRVWWLFRLRLLWLFGFRMLFNVVIGWLF